MPDQSTALLLLRLVLAVIVVIGLLLLTARLTRQIGTKGHGNDRTAVRLLSRHPLSRSASIAVVRSGQRTLVLGVTDHMVTLLCEEVADSYPDPGSDPFTRGGSSANEGALPADGPPPTGIIAKFRERTVRRS